GISLLYFAVRLWFGRTKWGHLDAPMSLATERCRERAAQHGGRKSKAHCRLLPTTFFIVAHSNNNGSCAVLVWDNNTARSGTQHIFLSTPTAARLRKAKECTQSKLHCY